jgi:hypothetical protein
MLLRQEHASPESFEDLSFDFVRGQGLGPQKHLNCKIDGFENGERKTWQAPPTVLNELEFDNGEGEKKA